MLNALLDLLFPKRCVACGSWGEYICKKCFSQIEIVKQPICPICQRQAVGGRTHPGCRGRWRLDGLAVACRYSGPVKRAIQKVKYKWIYDIEKVMVDLVVANLWRFDLPKEAVLVPVPLHAKRKRWRGFNQAEILGRSLAEGFGVPVVDTMIRIIETKTQVGLKRKDRKENVKGAFSIRGSTPNAHAKSGGVEPLQGKDIVLVDDVYTSGATMGECARVLRLAGAKSVWGLAVALG